MSSDESTFRPAFKLMSGRLAAFAIGFLTPVLLVRLFNQSEFGTYKQIFLITSTPYLIGCTFSECLFYFLPRNPNNAPRYVMNSMAMLWAIGSICMVGMVMNTERIATLMSNAALEPYVPMMSAYLVFVLVSTVLEITMISRKRYNLAAGTYVVSDLLRAIFLVVPALITRSLMWALFGTVVFFALRTIASLVYLRHEFGSQLHLDTTLMREQWAYTIPYSLAGIISIIQQNYHQYAVAHHFNAATFAIYSVGCLQIPLVDFLSTPTSNVMMVRMAERLRENDVHSTLPIWHDATRKLALLFFPLVGLLFVNAYQIITFLFTSAYRASVPIFMVWCLSILLAVFQTDGVLRVFAEIRYLFLTNVTRLTMLLLLMGWCLAKFQLMGPVMITLAGILLAKTMALVRIRTVLRTTAAGLLPWKSLGATLMVAMVAGIPAAAINSWLDIPTIVLLPISGMAYAVTYAALVLLFRLLSKDELESLKRILYVWNRRSALNTEKSAIG